MNNDCDRDPLQVATPRSSVHHANRNAKRPNSASTQSVGGASCSAVPSGAINRP